MRQHWIAVVVLFKDVEDLDFCGPIEVLSVANRVRGQSAFDIRTVAATRSLIRTRGQLMIQPAHSFDDCPASDILVVPGGSGTRKEVDNQQMIDWIRQRGQSAEIVISVCTGSLLLAKAGLLDGLEATTHYRALDLLRQLAPRACVQDDVRFTDNGKVVTSAGIAAGIDLTLHVVGRSVRKPRRRLPKRWSTIGHAKCDVANRDSWFARWMRGVATSFMGFVPSTTALPLRLPRQSAVLHSSA
jgi:transcriptional regulator GlxA family with amidase domain